MPSQDNINEPDNDWAAKLLKHKIESFNPYRKARLVQTKANIAYLCGIQNIQVINNQIVPVKESDPQYFAPFNKVLPAVINDIAVATKTPPKWDVVPTGTDEADKATAKAGDSILKYLIRINRFYEQRKAIVLWYDIDGIGWTKQYWNPNYKATNKEGNLEFEGEVVREHVPNTELIFDHRQKNNERRKWIIHAKTITVGEVRERWGDDMVDKLKAGSLHDKNTKDSFETELLGNFQVLSESIAPPTAKPDHSKLLKDDKELNYYEFWHVIDQNMSQGAYIIGLGKPGKLTIAENKPYPLTQYPHGQIPFTAYDPLSLDGIAVGAPARISQARPLQRYYNETAKIIKENIDVMGNGIFLAPRDANINVKKTDFGCANFVEYDGAMNKPDRQPGVPIPSATFAYLDSIAKMIDEIFAFHEPSKGIMPKGGPKSAIGLQILREADVAQLNPVIIALDRSDERSAHQMLTLALANYDQERQVSIVGEDNEWTLFKIDPEELKGKVNVIIRTGSSLPLNKTLEQEKAFSLWSSGLLGNPLDPNVRLKVLKVMDIGGFDQLLQANSKHINQAQKEFINAELLAMQAPPVEGVSIEKGQLVFADEGTKDIVSQYLYVPPVNEFDDHQTHLQEHTNFLLDKFNEYIGSGNPLLQVLGWAMRVHISQHQQIITMQQMQMAAMENPKLLESGKEKSTTNK